MLGFILPAAAALRGLYGLLRHAVRGAAMATGVYLVGRIVRKVTG